ncbi:MAG: hypothetical protein CHACPFDD_01692 [Phycisphaerae bacterium]|nr:hypothetical protein [Phycisphaerae bacterium]
MIVTTTPADRGARPTADRRPAGPRRGFTLFEALLVIMLLGVLTVFLWPDFDVMKRGEQLNESITRTRAAIAMCRAQAMNESRRYCITFKPDGSLFLTRQKDPLLAPEEYVLVGDGWAAHPALLDDVWIEAVQALPQGPPPLDAEEDDELVELLDKIDEPVPLEANFEIFFEPDGTSTSSRWILRETTGHGRKLTLDGRLGRVYVEEVEKLPEEDVRRPTPDDERPELQLVVETVTP